MTQHGSGLQRATIRGKIYTTVPAKSWHCEARKQNEEKEETMNYIPSTTTASALRDELRTSRIPFEDGDVIKFTAFGRYSYAAIRSEGKWYFTGGRNTFGQGVTDSKMIEILKDDKQDISYINAEAGETIV